MFHKLIKGIAPIAAMALGAAVSGCDMDVSINGEEGVPLAELDMSGDPPTELVLFGPDNVVLTDGQKLAIAVEGPAEVQDALRFTLSDGTLGILRKPNSGRLDGKATVRVTMPAPSSVTMAGSGRIEAPGMGENADINILGSGWLSVAAIDADRVDVNLLGSGGADVGGKANRLDLNVAGSGKVDMKGLKVERADVNVVGSGDASFASDGRVEANIMGSGTIRVIGRATCEVQAMGSGKLICEAGDATTTEAAAPDQAKAEPKAKAKAKAKKRVAKAKDNAKAPKKPRKA
ncbi:DUF2807 domain-containing protein [Altererythrobacter arenosus]|uniref:DUF2807 domain-containing protein n=1 Tax=Altererythrobacter arenosus TaxID=3032592 RepID=A0ABY8FZ61_9SPHN|nr:head GIN domain-containing protein [Altererythrobacter sp. CAU 1644]WFL78676.1 DUF2807 domain-containing protein [Altererythrobacter sp. CAU 1644]